MNHVCGKPCRRTTSGPPPLSRSAVGDRGGGARNRVGVPHLDGIDAAAFCASLTPEQHAWILTTLERAIADSDTSELHELWAENGPEDLEEWRCPVARRLESSEHWADPRQLAAAAQRGPEELPGPPSAQGLGGSVSFGSPLRVVLR
ncbi:DUF4259 domain-containing protein [Rhodococcus hoagii]|nr:DUF4259 domain-containing protein [Prescottella equi]